MRQLGSQMLCIVLGVSTGTAYAHEDTIFRISANGELVGVPEEYGPALLRVDGGGTAEAPKSVSLQVSGQVLLLPYCIVELFEPSRAEEIQASGSWYHERSLLPPYLLITLPAKRSSSGFYQGHSLLFNLETAALIEIARQELSADGNSMTAHSIAPATICSGSELEQLTPRRAE